MVNYQSWSVCEPETRNSKPETRNSSPHDFAKYQQNDKDKEETDGYQNKAQAGIIRSFLEHDGRHMMNFFDALHVPFDCAARDTRSAVQRLSSLVARPVQTLTNRAFIFPPSARLRRPPTLIMRR